MEAAHVVQLKNRKFPDFYLCFCGHGQCGPSHSFGPAVRPDYILHYILSGRGRFQAKGREYVLGKGEGFLIEPDEITFYEADEQEPWSYIWIGFSGRRAEEHLRTLGLGGERVVFVSRRGKDLEEIVMKMLGSNIYTVANEYFSEGLLYEFFAVLADSMDITANVRGGKGNVYFRKAVEFVQNNYVEPIRVTDIAAYVGLNRSYLSAIFREEMGMPPKEYLTRFRITRAAELLMTTELSVEQAGRSCGYQDPLVFSKNFKTVMGKAPSVYRRENREKQKREQIGMKYRN